MKKIISVCLILCALLGLLGITSCSLQKSQEPTEPETTEPEKTKQEIEFERAMQLAEEGAWHGSYLLLDDLMERGYYTEYKNKRDAIYEDYLIANAIYQALSFTKLKDKLKNPNSLVIYNISIVVTTIESEYGDIYSFEITYDYGASNSFGGMVRDTIKSSFSINEAKNYIGKTIDYSHVNLQDVAKLSSDEWRSKMTGDFKKYHYNRRDYVDDNIWK